MTEKILVLDTSAVMALVQDVTTWRDKSSPGFAGVLGDNEIVIPRVTIDELDRLKHAGGERAKIATECGKQLEGYTRLGSLVDGVETEKGGLLRIAPRPTNEKVIAWGLKASVADHEILATALVEEDALEVRKRETPELDCEVRLLTQDRMLRVLARSVYNLKAEELTSVWTPVSSDSFGYHNLEVDTETVSQFVETGKHKVDIPVCANEFVHLVDKDNPKDCYAYGISNGEENEIELIDRNRVDYLKVAGEIKGRNVRQKLLLWALMGGDDPDPSSADGVRLITVSGPAGSGKSFLTLAAAWERLERGHFDRIVITRPMVDVGTSLGFLPGTLEEKLKPWGGPVEDNLRAIVQVPQEEESKNSGRRGVQRSVRPFDAKAWLEMENRLELVPLTYIRGRTFRRSFVILEEAQNLEKGPLKVLLTRLGEGSLLVCVGDASQIDNQFLSPRNNGLVHAINAFRGWPQALHMHLKKVVRSDLADAANKLL